MMEPLLVVIFAPFVIAFIAIGLRQPMKVALPTFAALVPVGGGLAIGSSPYGSLSSLVGLVLGAGLILQLVSSRPVADRLSSPVPTWLLFLSLVGASVLWSINPATTINGFIVVTSLIIVYVFVSLSHVDRVVLRRTENALLVGGVAVVCYGLVQLFILGGFPSDSPGVGVAPDGRFGNDLLGPDNEAVALLLPLVIALSRCVTMIDRPKRLLHAVLAAMLLMGVLMTGARGGLLASIVAAIALAFTIPGSGRRRLLAYAGAGVVVAALVWVYHPGGVAYRTGETTSSSGRTDIWKVGLAACPRYCLGGSGWGTFPDVYADTQASVPGARVLVGDIGTYQAHNLWLLVAIELGVPGLLLLASGLLMALWQALRLPINLRGPPFSALLGTIFAASFLSNLEFKFFWMALIAVALARNLSDTEAARQSRGPAAAAQTGGEALVPSRS